MNTTEIVENYLKFFPGAAQVSRDLINIAFHAAKSGDEDSSKLYMSMAQLVTSQHKLAVLLAHYLTYGENLFPKERYVRVLEHLDSEMFAAMPKIPEDFIRSALGE